jgi:Transglycosylase SLT domain
MKKLFLFLFLLTFYFVAVSGNTRMRKNCSKICIGKSIITYMEYVEDCPDFCQKRKGKEKEMCRQRCIIDAREEVFDQFDNCIEKCELDYQVLRKKYKWLKPGLYNLYKKRAAEYRIPLNLALAVIHAESRGKNVISKKNKNGSRDWGRMQVNSIHMKRNPRLLLNDKINSRVGFWYLSAAYKKSGYNLKETVRLYNQGLAGKRSNYKNWKYVTSILLLVGGES